MTHAQIPAPKCRGWLATAPARHGAKACPHLPLDPPGVGRVRRARCVAITSSPSPWPNSQPEGR